MDDVDDLEPSIAQLNHFIRGLATAPETQMDPEYSGRCADFDGSDPVRFLRDLRDAMVYTAGCSDFVIGVISTAIDKFPESEEDREARHAELETKRSEVDDVLPVVEKARPWWRRLLGLP